MKQTKPLKIQTQREAFIAKATELGVATEDVFNTALKRIASAKVVAGKSKAKPSKKSR